MCHNLVPTCKSAARELCRPPQVMLSRQMKEKANQIPGWLALAVLISLSSPFPSPFRRQSLQRASTIDSALIVASVYLRKEMDRPPPVLMSSSLYLSSVDLMYVDGGRSVRQPQPLELRPNPPKLASPISSFFDLASSRAWDPWQFPLSARA